MLFSLLLLACVCLCFWCAASSAWNL